MTAQLCASISPSLQSLQPCKEHKERLIQEIDKFTQDIKTAKQVGKYTAEIKRRIDSLEKKIEENKIKITEVDKMLELAPGSWVRNGTTRPGKVVNLVIAGRIPEVHVQWAGDSVCIPERPLQLKLLQPEDIGYVWNGDRLPKLVRRIDQHECDEIAVLVENQDRLATIKRLAIREGCDEDIINGYSSQIVYCKKQIKWVNQQDLAKLEHIVKQGLDIFYRVGSALAEIRDRKLFKDLGYSDFREYLKERWDMKKSRAYQLIESASVVSNLSVTAKSVHHGGHFLPSAYESTEETLVLPIPTSERITRELAKLPAEQQSQAWLKAVETAVDNNPTAAHTKAVVNQFVEPVGGNKKLVEQFEIGQLVKVQLTSFDGASENLKSANHYYGQITGLTENKCSFNVNVFGHKSFVLSPQDIKPVDSVRFCVEFSPQQFVALMSVHQTKDCLEDAIKKGVLK